VTTYVTPAQFAVDLSTLNDAIGTVQTAAQAIEADTQTISTQMTALQADWISPAGTTFAEIAAAAQVAMQNMNNLLADIIARMRLSYQNYVVTETANTNNVS
jgi:WXG100 family type VII secretion target